MSISSELLTLQNTKTAIRTAINSKGGSVGASDTFASYATAIDNLPSGGSNADLIDLIERDITSINIPSGTTSIGDSAFSTINTLTSVTIPNTVTYIGKNAFANCENLVNITIPSSVTRFDTNSFYRCTGLTSVTIPNGVTTIPSSCFLGAGFSNISFPISVTSIGVQAFKNSKLTTLSIPDTITNINNSAFEGCSQLTSVVIGTGITTMPNAVFYNCTALQSVVIKATNPPTQTNAFNNTNNCPIYVPAASVDTYKAASGWSTYASRIYPIQQVATVDGNPVYNYDLGVTDVSTLTDLQVAALPSGDVLEFAEGVQYVQGEITGYTSVTMPSSFVGFSNTQPIGSSVTTLTSKATTPPGVERNNLGGSGLTAIYVPYGYGATYQSAAAWSTFSSIIQELPAPPKAVLTLSNSTTVNVPGDGTTILQKSDVTAVATITDIVSAVVNEGITALNSLGGNTSAFFGATNLSSVTLPSTLTQISGQAFRNTALASIYIPENVASVAPGAFENCPLASITVDANNSTYTSRNNCNAVIDTTNEMLVLGCSSTVIDTDVKIIGSSAFRGRTSLTSVTIPDGAIMYIDDSAFNGCTNLTSVTCMAASAPSLGQYVFDDTNDCPIYVPAEYLEDYTGEWFDYEDRIEALPSE